MKKMILAAAVIAAAAMTVSCNKDTESTGLGVDAEAINYPLSGGTYDINLTSGKPWKALYCAEWLTVTPESGTGNATVTIAVDAWNNEDSEEARIAGVHLTDGIDTVAVLIGQINDDNYSGISAPEVDHVIRPHFDYLNVSNDNIQFPSQGGSYIIYVDTDTDWWWIENDTDWLSFSPTGGPRGWQAFTVYVQEWENPDNEENRTATFKVEWKTRPESDSFSYYPIVVTQLNDSSIEPGPAAI